MIKHIVIFRLTGVPSASEREESLQKLQDAFAPLGKILDFIPEYRTGRNFLKADYAGDFIIDALFNSEEDLRRYQVSGAHKKAVAEASVVQKTKIVVDYVI